MPAKTAFQSGRLAEPGRFEPLVLPRKKRRLSRRPKIDLRPLLLPKINRHDPQRDQEFESLLLQRGVWCEPSFRRSFAKLRASRLKLKLTRTVLTQANAPAGA